MVVLLMDVLVEVLFEHQGVLVEGLSGQDVGLFIVQFFLDHSIANSASTKTNLNFLEDHHDQEVHILVLEDHQVQDQVFFIDQVVTKTCLLIYPFGLLL